jgi:hypothetical protein
MLINFYAKYKFKIKYVFVNNFSNLGVRYYLDPMA